MKKLLCVLLTALLCLGLFSCFGGDECTEHVDSDADGKCDACGAAVKLPEDDDPAPVASELTFIEDGKATFQIVISKNSSNSIVQKAAKSIVDALAELDIDVDSVTETATNAKDCEVIIGTPTLRGEDYEYDARALGAKGYAIKLIKGKILILGGSDEALVDAVKVFIEDFLGIDKKTKELDTVIIKETSSVEVVQDDYKITSVKIDGEDMRGYTIAADTKDKTIKTVAESMQNTIYLKSGYWFDIVPVEDADKSIVINVKQNTYEGDGFYIDVKDGQLVIETEFPNKLADNVAQFVSTNFVISTGDINFTRKTHKTSVNVRTITYEDFGAKSNDGKDDFDAFYKTHEYANAWGHSVKAKAGGVYQFGKGSGSKSITIKTDTDWNGCKLIFIDTDIIANEDPEFFANIFKILPDGDTYSYPVDVSNFAHVTADNPWIDEGDNVTTNIGWKPGKKVLLYITSDERKQYIRYGANENNGSNQQEVLLVDADGNIDPETPLQWSYTKITTARIYSATERQITVGNCKIEQWMNHSPSLYNYAERNIMISRSNVIFTDVVHQIVDEPEGDSGSEPYTGFVVIQNCDNALVRNYTFKGPKSYYTSNSNSGARTIMGSYGTTAARCTNITWDHVVQTDYRQADGTIAKNGSHGTNYCKNLLLTNNSALSLFDAHCGTYNATILNSEVVSLNLIGEGLLYMENVNMAVDGKSHYTIGLREDYGATWKGEVILKDCTIVGAVGMTDYSLFHAGSYQANHHFGYDCYFPSKITIDGLKTEKFLPDTKIHLADWLEKYKKVDISVPSAQGGDGGINPYIGCKELIIKNCSFDNWLLPSTPQFDGMKVYIDGYECTDWKIRYGLK